ncbi:hypothetical protein [Solicola gregarius]|uniref:Nudix hydrolase domain-containing protein n=1 Tax=Solicola gregarius TaxID=2908642 RepID=A0AA46YLJ2_9ACTN|nr:hypothetical protein [Solicola gregarius]UYM05639.1 hypothetical protein L0C25_00705 [Solicola gregarius]
MPRSRLGIDAALLVIDRNHLLVTQTRDDPTLRLPGGALHDGDDAHHVLTRYASRLGIDVDRRSLKRSTLVPPSTTHQRSVATETIYFETPKAHQMEDHTASDLTWATSRMPGVFTPAASAALTTLHRSGRIE